RSALPVLVDCTAADGMETLYLEAFRRGIHVVAANKKPLVLPLERTAAVADTARRHLRAWHYETTVGAGLPVIETLRNLIATGDVVERIDGCLSGTLGFLCQELMAGSPLSVAVRTARDRGYTEPHPRDDLSGLDVARKALILARELGLSLELEDVAVEPFVEPSLLAENDPERFLRSLAAHDEAFGARVVRHATAGRTLRYLAQIVPGAGGRKVRVGPLAVEPGHPAVPLRGAEALVSFTTARYRDDPLVVRGAGAGGDVTAAGVLADVLRLTRNAGAAPGQRAGCRRGWVSVHGTAAWGRLCSRRAMAPDDDDESPAAEPEPKRLALRRLFEERLSQFPADSRTRLAGQLGDPELQALCFDPLPNVARALVENPRFGLVHARLLAAHHPHPTGLSALTKKESFLRDPEVQRMLLRNVQTPPALLQRIFHQRRLLDLFQLSVGREMPEKNKLASREAFRGRWSSGMSEEKVDVLFRTEG